MRLQNQAGASPGEFKRQAKSGHGIYQRRNHQTMRRVGDGHRMSAGDSGPSGTCCRETCGVAMEGSRSGDEDSDRVARRQMALARDGILRFTDEKLIVSELTFSSPSRKTPNSSIFR